MTDTPETEENKGCVNIHFVFCIDPENGELVKADFARKLERERDNAIETMKKTRDNSGEIIASQADENILLTEERDELIASPKFHADLNKELVAERSRLGNALNVLPYWRDVSECVCSDPLPNGGCLRCDLDKIFNATI